VETPTTVFTGLRAEGQIGTTEGGGNYSVSISVGGCFVGLCVEIGSHSVGVGVGLDEGFSIQYGAGTGSSHKGLGVEGSCTAGPLYASGTYDGLSVSPNAGANITRENFEIGCNAMSIYGW
jgi:hypothetical protein